MTLRNRSYVAHCKVNGTYSLGARSGPLKDLDIRPVGNDVDPRLMACLRKLCCVRKNSAGVITKAARNANREDLQAAMDHCGEKNAEEIKEAERLASVRANRRNAAGEVILCNTATQMHAELAACASKKSKLKFLKGQMDCRLEFHKRKYDSIGTQYRVKAGGRLRKKAPGGDERDEVQYLSDLMALMIEVDSGRDCSDLPSEQRLVRELPVLSSQHTSALSLNLKIEQQVRVHAEACPHDDPLGLKYHDAYVGKLMRDEGKTYKIVSVNTNDKAKPEYWMASLLQVDRSASGIWEVPEASLVRGAAGEIAYRHDKFEYMYLADISDPSNAREFDDVAKAVSAHEDAEASFSAPP